MEYPVYKTFFERDQAEALAQILRDNIRKTLPSGERVHAYNMQDRTHGITFSLSAW